MPKEKESKPEEEPNMNIFQKLSGEKLMSLQGTIDDINELMEVRESLEQEVFKDIEKAKSKINNFIMRTEAQITPEQRTALIKEIVTLKAKELDLEQMKVQEKLSKFKDIADLKKELRQVVQEHREKESSADILDQILEK